MQQSQRGQVEINEVLLVLFVIVLIIVIGTLVYFRFFLASVQTVAGQLSEQESTILLASITTLPEIRCAQRDCIDASKFIPFQTISQHEQEYYLPLLGYKKIVVELVYPPASVNEVCSLELYAQDSYPQNCGSWVLYDQQPSVIKQKILVSTFVSLYFPELGEYHLGRLGVTSYV